MKTRICTKCKEKKLLSNFYKDKYNKDGHKSHCKKCSKKYHTAYCKKNRQKENKRSVDYKRSHPRCALNSRLKNAHDITLGQYDKMLEEQNGVCEICGKKETHKNQYGVQRLGVDHNHITNKNRGLLCVCCNTAIGSLYIDEKGIELLLKAMEYTQKYSK